ncbi:hypothetical protein CTEN210_02530 [Chaetoceros tenuissimus]|uniref:CSC1/OSCA1-like cytosolic domain-containing protein n=1 Tax=Chaetoceros tenuissimus TaxID=426638 RepID=A0AAD3CJL0_9STRA|nr:hypothetical protein CTEN210_02530 [Chaetoceros tenuissimus]
MEDLMLMDSACRTIQWCYINYKQRISARRSSFGSIVVDVMSGEHYVHALTSNMEHSQEGHVDDVEQGQCRMGMTSEYFEEDHNAEDFQDCEKILENDDLQNNEIREIRADTIINGDNSLPLYVLDDDQQNESIGGNGSGTNTKDIDKHAFDTDFQEEELLELQRQEMQLDSGKEAPTNFPPAHVEVDATKARHVKRRKGNKGKEVEEGESIKKRSQLEDELSKEWVRPSWKLAKEFEALSAPHHGKKKLRYNWRSATTGRHCMMGGCGEQLDLWNEGVMSEFAQFGSGITNYFKFQKWCCWIMFILAIIHTPVLLINLFGEGMTTDGGGILEKTTLGNLGTAEVQYVTIPYCDSTKYQMDYCKISKNTIAILYAMLDVTGTLIVILGYYWLKSFEKSEEDHLNRTTVTASDYTLQISNIPKNITEREIAAHFAQITSSPIAEVNLAFNNAKEIQMYMRRGRVMKKRVDCINKIQYERSIGEKQKGEKSASRRRIRKLLRERNRLTSQVDIKDAERALNVSAQPDVIQAFVTFDTEEGFVKAISEYSLNWIRSIPCFYPKRLRLGGVKIRVKQAPEPSTLVWENIEIKERHRFGRKCLTSVIAVLALLLSIFFTFYARHIKIKTLNASSGVCPSYFTELSRDEQRAMVEADTRLAHCYCGGLEKAQDLINDEICEAFVKEKLKSVLITYGASFIVVFINMFFTTLMDKSGTFEKHQSLDDMESSNMTRLFLLKFLNTGCLVLFYGIKFMQVMMDVKFDDPQNFNIEWYETGGVGLIMVMIINIFSPHIGSFLAYRKYRSKIRKLEQNLTKDKMYVDEKFKIFYSQDELNEIYLGPPFRLNFRYTILLVNFYVCWMYSISMPLLPMIGAVSFFCSYWIDKYLFCNFYRIPPRYSFKMGSRSSTLIGFAVIAHLIISCLVLGNNQVFVGESIRDSINESISDTIIQTDLKLSDMLMKKHIVLLEIVAFMFILNFLVRHTLSTFGSTIQKVMRCIICRKADEVRRLEAVMNAVQVTYKAARTRGVIKGVSSYNILQNPRYQELFQITQEFAKKHNRLSSIRGYNTKEKVQYNSELEASSSCSDIT